MEAVWDQPYFRHVSTSEAVEVYHSPQLGYTDGAGAGLSDNTLYLAPMHTGWGGNINGLLLAGLTGSSGYLRVGLYYCINDSLNCYPGSLMADIGTVTITSATTAFSFAAITTTPPHALMWIAVIQDSWCNFTYNRVLISHPPLWGTQRTALNNAPVGVLTLSWSPITAFPNPFPFSGSTVATWLQMGFRYSSIP